MNRQSLSALAMVGYGGVLVGLYLRQGLGRDLPTLLRIGPFLLVATTIGYTGVWLLRHPIYRSQAHWVVAWTIGGGTTFMALAALVVLNHWVDVATTTPAARTILDTVTGGSLAGAVAGLYDAQSRQRYSDLQTERDTIERFANKAASLNRYGQALYESTHIDELSALSIEVVQLLIGSQEAAFILVGEDTVRVVDATFPDPNLLEPVAQEVATFDPMQTVRRPAETDCRPPLGTSIDSLVAVPIPAGDVNTAVLLAVPESSAAYSEEDTDLLELLSAHVASALSDVDADAMTPPVS